MKRLSRWLGLAFLVCLNAATTPSADLPPVKGGVAIIAHRGGSSLAPENTLAAFRRAMELGVDYVEVDVRQTKDGGLVCMHDSTVDRTTNGKGKVEELTLEEIQALDAGSWFSQEYRGERVPTFQEVLSLCKDKIHVYLDHKEGETEKIWKALREADMLGSVVVYNGVAELQEWKRIAPEVPVMPSLPDRFQRQGGVEMFLKILPAEVLDGNLGDWSRERVAEAHGQGVQVYVDCLGLHDSAPWHKRALEMGVDGIQTDRPDRLVEVLRAEQQTNERMKRE